MQYEELKNDAFFVKANYSVAIDGSVKSTIDNYTYSNDGVDYKSLGDISKDIANLRKKKEGGKSRNSNNIPKSKKKNVRTYRKRRKNVNI